MILNCSNISKAFGTDEIIKDASFHIEDREKAAIVGVNGAGKSTFLKIITGELMPDTGLVTLAKGATLGYLAQIKDLTDDKTVYEEVFAVKKDIIDMEMKLRDLEHRMREVEGDELENLLETYTRINHEFELNNGYAARSEITGVLKGLGFTEEEFDKPVRTLSGGQKTRVSLSKLLLASPDILLLDEPTNHLDLPSISWLETFLSNYNGSVIVVAHDRYFLDKVATKIIEIDHGKVTVFMGSYSDYSVKKKQLRDAELKAYYNNQRVIKHQEEVIEKLRSFNREKSIKRAESREKMLSKIEVVEKPMTSEEAMHFKLEPAIISGNDVLSVSGLTKSFGSNTLFSGIDFEIKRGERVALIGANGTGKSTILKILTGMIEADYGSFRLGSNVEIGYYDQEHHELSPEKTLFEEISDTYPDLTNTRIRNVLASFLFTNDDVFKRIADLSGGERGRVLLAKLMLSNANFLILDEPTNHLDINSKEILENALNNYSGTCFFVSHDRYFINAAATRILDLRNNCITNYIGNYDYYMEKLQSPSINSSAQDSSSSDSISSSKEDRMRQKEEQARLRKLSNELERIENRITEIDELIAALDADMALEENYSSPSKAAALATKRQDLELEQTELYDKWDELSQ